LQSAIENLKSKMSAVPVVQRIEQGFPNSSVFRSCEGANSNENARKCHFMPQTDIYLAISGDD
jgi:hypothetical protein